MKSSLYSMTGFGRACLDNEFCSVEVEIRAVNSRFLDLVIKAPKVYNVFEPLIRKQISKVVKRGRVEVFIQRSVQKLEEGTLVLQEAVFKAYQDLYESAFEKVGLKKQLNAEAVTEILSKRDVIVPKENIQQDQGEQELLSAVIDSALSDLQKSRSSEGVSLLKDISGRFANLETIVSEIHTQAGQETKSIKQRILERIQALSEDLKLDPDRIALEAALVADKVDITEELVRLDSHISQTSKILNEPPHGKKLEFLLQECGREVNTIGSKSQNVIVKQLVLDAKNELEKLREQVMNVE